MAGSTAPAEQSGAPNGVELQQAGGAPGGDAAASVAPDDVAGAGGAGGDVEAAVVAEKPEFGAPQDMSYLQVRPLAPCSLKRVARLLRSIART